MKTPVVLLTMFFAALAVTAHSVRAGTSVSQTSDPVKIEAALVPEKSSFLSGEPIFVTFTLRNKGTQDLNVCLGDPIYYNVPSHGRDYFKFTVTDAQGHEMPQIPGHRPGFSAFTLPFPCKLPIGGGYTVPLFLPQRIVLDKPGDYTITVTKTVQFSLLSDSQRKYANFADVSPNDETVSATITVLPADPEKMGRIINDLGEKTVAYGKSATGDESAKLRDEEDCFHGGLKPDGGVESFEKLTAIHDEREIPWLLQVVLTTRDDGLRSCALTALSAFGSDAAFASLKAAMATPANEVVDAPFERNPNQPPISAVDSFRQMVLEAITESKHPGAIAYALTFRHDPDAGMRITVASMACRMKPEESIPVLRELSRDSDHDVSDEAKAGLYRACVQIKPEEAIPILRELAGDSDDELSSLAKAALDSAQKKLGSSSFHAD